MTTCTTTATAQGYLPAPHRPQCGNCYLRKEPERQVTEPRPALIGCKHGGFAVAPDGWCTVWLPERNWIEIHTDAAARLGLSLGGTD